MKKISFLILAFIMLASTFIMTGCFGKDDPPAVETVYILKDGASEYDIVFSAKGVNHTPAASELFTKMVLDLGADIDRIDYPSSDKVSEKEILIGDTDRPLSVELKAAVDKKAGDGGVAWGYAYRDGKLAYYANSTAALELSWKSFYELIVKKNTVEVKSDLYVVDGMTKAEYEQYMIDEADRIAAEKEAARKETIAVLKERIAAINTKFDSIPNFTPIFGTPSMKITASHPRVWVDSDAVSVLRNNIYSLESKALLNKVLAQADLGYTGRLGALQPGADHNFNVENDLATIEALAAMYLVTDDEIYGYSAIRAAKNLLDTAIIKPRSEWESDGARLYTVSNACSTAMGIIAEVYDWCYPLLHDNDKTYIVEATLNKLAGNLEVANPPSNGGCVTGHSTSALTLRDWPSFAIAVADEYPEIYTYIIGLAENYYAPPANWYYPSGANFQGTSYGINKTSLHLQSDMLVFVATGEHLYDVSFEDTMFSFIHGVRPDDEQIRLGDNYSYGASWGYNTDWRPAFYGYLYYKNPVLKAWLKHQTDNFSKLTFKSGSLNKMLETSPIKALLLNDPTIKCDGKQFELELVHYTGAPLSSLFARSAWGDADAWFTYVNMAEAYGANHDHLDAGTFQIYYKGVLAPETGIYQNYGTLLDYSWTKQTIANNGLLIYNPAYEKTDGRAKTYSGGQTTVDLSENATLDQWLERDTSRQSVVLGKGHSYGAGGELIYAYMSGDITNAYDKDTVDLVMRSTMSVATGDETQPLIFIVYDRITSDNATFKKSFLLHTMDDPTFGAGHKVTAHDSESGIRFVDGTNMFYYTNVKGSSGAYAEDDPDDKYNGKLTNTTLLPENPTYRVIGGDGYRFWVDRKGDVFIGTYGEESCNAVINNLPSAETSWGRVEISPSENNLTDSFLNVMIVGDADGNDAYVAPTLVKGDTHEGAISFGNCVMFSKSNERITDAFSFTASADGVLTYYVSGLSEGKWEVSLNGSKLTEVTVDRESGLASFKANAGEITFTPEFRPLKLELVGGAFSEGVTEPVIYPIGESLTLPTDLVLDYFAFDGWYDNPDYNGKPITALDGTDIGEVRLYARWRQVQAKLSFELNKGSFDGELPTRYDYGKTLALPTDLTLYGSEFAGWYLDESFTGSEITEIGVDMRGDITLYAKWEKVFDVLAFELNGGSMDGDVRIKLPQEAYTLPIPTKRGCVFAGWYLDGEFTKRISVVTPDLGDCTVYAYWLELVESSTGTEKNELFMGGINLKYGDALAANGGVLTMVFKADPKGAGVAREATIRVRNKFMRNAVYPLSFENDIILDANGEPLVSFKDGATIEIIMDVFGKELRYFVNGTFAARCEAAFNDDYSTYNFENINGVTEINYLWQYYGATPGNSLFNISVYAGDAHLDVKELSSIEYELNGGEFNRFAPKEYSPAAGLTLPIPEKTAYAFAGWYTTPDCQGEPVTRIDAGSDTPYKFYAKWAKVGDTVSFELNGGFTEETLIREYKFGEEVILPTAVTKNGFEFAGWYRSADFSAGPITKIPANAEGPYDLYAKWVKVKGFLTFELNGGSCAEVLPEEYKYGEVFALPSNLTKYGSTFIGWFLDGEFTGSPMSELPADQTGDLTLYAKWQKDFGVIYLDVDGGSYTDSFSDRVTVGVPVILPVNITRENSVFCGWYRDKEFTKKVETITPETNDDIYVYARWNVLVENSPSSGFNPINNAVTGVNNIKYGDYLVKSNGYLTLVFKADPSSAGATRDGVIRIRNRYLKNQVTVFNFKNDDIKTSAGDVISSMKNGDEIKVVMDFVSGKLYYFVNDVYTADSSVTFNSDLLSYNFGESDQTVPYLWQYNAGGNYTFDIKVWSGDICGVSEAGFGELSFELNDGVLSGSAPTQYWSGTVTTLPTPEKYGSTFLGWYDNATFTGSPVTEIAKGTSGDLKFYAKWQKDFSVIQLQLGGGRINGSFDAKIYGTETVTLPTSVTKSGSIFGGWYSDSDFTNKITEISSPDGNDVYAYAKWHEIYWSKGSNASPHEYYYENGDIGSKMLAAGVDTLTLRLDTATSGNASWENGGIRLRTGTGSTEAWVINFTGGNMTSIGGTVLTAMNSGDVVSVVIDFTEKTCTYYVNGEFKCKDSTDKLNSDLTYYNYATPAGGAASVARTNMFQLTNAGDVARTFSYDSVQILSGEYTE